jgi:hypothetical protein
MGDMDGTLWQSVTTVSAYTLAHPSASPPLKRGTPMEMACVMRRTGSMASSEALKAFDPPGCWPLRSGGERVSLRWSRCAAIDEADVAGGLSEKREEDLILRLPSLEARP